ncbi:CDP-glycerol glycerophosphotransferase family protein [Streptomyces sp. NPDC059169]|uniref:bifunctional glycosyltransferase/CDP-glycerol:glycerophosphate glycerophosphotransferase n=1 Tax=Streptomyces sp. NPDC059169 TaxID=3346754 RepID=UPI0036AE5024
MPRFTVIVPVHKVQASLRRCLESVLTQSYDDLEVIAVDDGSPSGCGSVLDACAARDRRVIPLRLPGGGGVGGARNAGLARASGDYLIFLDGDDVLVPGALRAVADRITETGEPDVLVYGFAYTDRRGRAVQRDDAGLLSEEGSAPFPPCGRPGLLHHPAAARSRAYRRGFVEHNGFAFPPGPGPDAAWGCPVLVCARTIATLDRVCVRSRARRRGVALGGVHAGVPARDRRAVAASRPGARTGRPAVLLRRLSGRVTGRAAATSRRLRRGGATSLQHTLDRYRRRHGRAAVTPVWPWDARARTSGHRAHRTRHAARTLRAALGRGAATAYRTLVRAVLRAQEGFQLRLPVGPRLAVFTADGGAFPGAGPGAIGATARELASHLRAACAAGVQRRRGLPPRVRRLLRQDAAGRWSASARTTHTGRGGDLGAPGDGALLSAGPVRYDTSLFGPPAASGPAPRGRRTAARGGGHTVSDSVDGGYGLSAQRRSSVRERAFPSGYTTLAQGSPRSEVLRRATEGDVAALREELGIPKGCTALLYAPAHRDRRRPRLPGPDLDRVRRVLGPRFVVLTHEGTGRHSIEALCLAADALVTGFSSLMFDYASLDRPIVVYAGDWEAYEAARGTYVDLRSCPPGPIVRTEDELIGVFASGRWRGSHSAQLRASFRARFCPYDDGRASGRSPRPGGPASVPFDERHPAPVAAPVTAPFPSHVHR